MHVTYVTVCFHNAVGRVAPTLDTILPLTYALLKYEHRVFMHNYLLAARVQGKREDRKGNS